MCWSISRRNFLQTSGTPTLIKRASQNSPSCMYKNKGLKSSKRPEPDRVGCKNIPPVRGLLTHHNHSTCLSRARKSRGVRSVVLSKPIRMEVWQRRARKVRLLCPFRHCLVEARAMENHLRTSPDADLARSWQKREAQQLTAPQLRRRP